MASARAWQAGQSMKQGMTAMTDDSALGPVASRIQEALTEGLAPAHLVLEDQSHRHQGHAGHDGRGESHFHVAIISQAFAGKNRVARHRMVMDLLRAELADRVHALSISAKTPEEAG